MSLLVLAAIALAVLAGFTALVIGLTSASWQVLLVLLVLVWLITERLLKQLEAPVGNQLGDTTVGGNPVDQSTVSSFGDPDTLTYRGAKYHTSTAAEMAVISLEHHELSGKYRGCTWKTSDPETATAMQPLVVEMKYRGAKVADPEH